MKKKYAIYTSIFNRHDSLKDPVQLSFNEDEVDFICFTDDPYLTSKLFEIRVEPNYFQLDSRRTSRIFKMLPHVFLREYEYTLHIDANMELQYVDMDAWVKKFLKKHNITFFRHPERSNLADEADTILAHNLDTDANIKRQLNDYVLAGYKADSGMHAGGFILRKNHEKDVKKFNEQWWKHYNMYGCRDQMSLDYVAWEQKIKLGTIEDANYFDNDIFKVRRHKRI